MLKVFIVISKSFLWATLVLVVLLYTHIHNDPLVLFLDSDGKEFEDDPLLQVLRRQRTWVKKQIR